MNQHLHTAPDPDFSPSIPPKPGQDKPTDPAIAPRPEAPDEEELPPPAIFPTA